MVGIKECGDIERYFAPRQVAVAQYPFLRHAFSGLNAETSLYDGRRQTINRFNALGIMRLRGFLQALAR